MVFGGIQLTIFAGLWCHVHGVQPGADTALENETRDAMALLQTGAMHVLEHDDHGGEAKEACVPVVKRDFESGTLLQIPTGWMRYGNYGSTGLLTTDEAHTDERSIYFEGPGWQLIENGPAEGDAWSVTSGVTYTVSFWARTDNGDSGFKVRTEFIVYNSFTKDSSHSGILPGSAPDYNDVVPGQWTQFTYTFTPTLSSSKVRMNIGKTADSPSTGRVYIDSISLSCGEEFWPQILPDNTKCVVETDYYASSQYVCQTEAIAAGHSYFQYDSGTGKCMTVSACNSQIPGSASSNWKVYESPTASQTASPTASPTARTEANLVGDPHITAVGGYRFDFHFTGNVTLLQVPKSTEVEPLLALTGSLRNADPECHAGTYLTSLRASGAWLPHVHEFWPQPRRSRQRRKQRLSVGPHGITVVVVHGRTDTGVAYLNLRVGGLGRLRLPIGGLLSGDVPQELNASGECL